MINLPARIHDTWDWFSGIWAWDYADPIPLADLIRGCGGAIPGEYVQAVADIVSGDRKANKKAGAKLQIPAAELGKMTGSLMAIRDLTTSLRKDAMVDLKSDLRGVHALAKAKGLRPLAVTRMLEYEWRNTKEEAAEMFNVDLRTIERILREADERIKRWPNF